MPSFGKQGLLEEAVSSFFFQIGNIDISPSWEKDL